MAITYDAPSNTITVTGYTEGTPCTLLDIWNADQAGGWGVVSKQNDVQFLFACKLVIGDGSTETWFADAEKQIVFSDGIATGNSQFLIEGKRYAHVRFGILEDAANKVTSSGVSFISLESTRNSIRFIWTSGSSGGECLLYSCAFNATSRLHFLGTNREADDKIYHCSFSNVCPFQASGDFYDIVVQSSAYGMYATGTMERIWLGDVSTAMYARYSGAYTFKNVEVKTPYTRLFYLYSKSTNPIYAINVEAPTWSFLWGGTSTVPLYRQYEFDLTVTDKDNNPINGATVTLKDKDGSQVFQVTTDVNGEIATQTVSRGYYDQANGDALQDYGPHTLTIEKGGYQTYEKRFMLKEKTTWEIKLAKAVGVFLDFGRPVVNLKKSNPENKVVMVL